MPDAALGHHFMQQLLAPGTLCQQALSQALQELGQPLALKHASLEEAQHHLTAAAQVQTLPALARNNKAQLNHMPLKELHKCM